MASDSLLDPVLNPALRQQLRRRRNLWRLRCRQRRRQAGQLPSLARLGNPDPQRGQPLDQPGLLSTLQHRGPLWWYTNTLLQGEETSQQLLRTLLLQQQLWRRLKRLKQQRRRQKFQKPRWRRRALPSLLESDKRGVRRLERPLRRSRRRHQLKAQENLGRSYRPQELEQLTSRLVAVLQPKIRRHRRRLEQAKQRRFSAGQKLLRWLRGGTLPRRRASRGAARTLSKRLGGRTNPLQRHRRAQQRRLEERREQLALKKTQRWLLKMQEEATRSKEKHRREAEERREQQETLKYAVGGASPEGENPAAETPEESPRSPAPAAQTSAEDLRLKQQDRRSENRAYAQMSARLAALEKAVLEPLMRGQRSLPPRRLREAIDRLRRRQCWLRNRLTEMYRELREQWDAEGYRPPRPHPRQPHHRHLRLLLAHQTRLWRRKLVRRLHRWRRGLQRQLQFWALLHPLLRAPDQQLAHKKALRRRKEREKRKWEKLQAAQEQARKARGSYRRSGLGGPPKPFQGTAQQMRRRWRRFFQPPVGDGFQRFSPFSYFTKGGLFS